MEIKENFITINYKSFIYLTIKLNNYCHELNCIVPQNIDKNKMSNIIYMADKILMYSRYIDEVILNNQYTEFYIIIKLRNKRNKRTIIVCNYENTFIEIRRGCDLYIFHTFDEFLEYLKSTAFYHNQNDIKIAIKD